ncbi:hypothetical protein HUW51_14065 [Adhaeribacter swui]|uniref:DUF3471 domain-containing protein n=1 Tax=Adhaeribacter swui TaxID=2086471 RepID=A0A7G7G9F7_9BACT|nr:hypothetical protein [Adhaeribacter swui]QNF33791.1 hypothetical protein HUW51_14065 [Adhaeribacter swui]
MKSSSSLRIQLNYAFSFTLAIILVLLFTPNRLMAQSTNQNTTDLKQFAGTYQLLGKQDLALQISPAANGLTLKEMWSNREINFKQNAGLSFVAEEHPDFTLDFARDAGGTIHQVTAFKRDIWIRSNPGNSEKQRTAAETTRLNLAYQKIFLAFQEAINTNATDQIQNFMKTYLDESLLSAATMEGLIAKAKEMYQNTGGITLDPTKPINPETGTATFKSKKQGIPFQMNFTLNTAGKITNFGMQE